MHDCCRSGLGQAAQTFHLLGVAELEERAVVVDAGTSRDRLAACLLQRRRDFAFAAVPVALDDPSCAARLWRRIERLARSPENLRVVPRHPLPYCGAPATAANGWTTLDEWDARGAWLCGDPALEATGRASVPFLLPLARMRTSRLRAFLARAA